ncbi:hypothetical protein BC831DRAFT_305597 [Entophlyctis helioformis]|nr:hypothetical protein BC831DRAFT_305597 [Entophlyctis helioformis]
MPAWPAGWLACGQNVSPLSLHLDNKSIYSASHGMNDASSDREAAEQTALLDRLRASRVRRHGCEPPFHPRQVFTIMYSLASLAAFYAIQVNLVDAAWLRILLMTLVATWAAGLAVIGTALMLSDPADRALLLRRQQQQQQSMQMQQKIAPGSAVPEPSTGTDTAPMVPATPSASKFACWPSWSATNLYADDAESLAQKQFCYVCMLHVLATLQVLQQMRSSHRPSLLLHQQLHWSPQL